MGGGWNGSLSALLLVQQNNFTLKGNHEIVRRAVGDLRTLLCWFTWFHKVKHFPHSSSGGPMWNEPNPNFTIKGNESYSDSTKQQTQPQQKWRVHSQDNSKIIFIPNKIHNHGQLLD